MRKLGLIGGVSWASTALYYEQINKAVAQRLGGLHSASMVIESIDLAPIAAMQQAEEWLAVGHQLVTAVSGAVVLETKQQYDAHDLTPVNAAPLPPGVWAALAMLPVLWMGRRWMRPARAA